MKHIVRTRPPYLDLSILDVMRGLAALYVMLGHARWLLWSSQKEFATTQHNAVESLAALISAGLTYGHQAVLLFFLISGFCIHYSQARSLAASDLEGQRGQLHVRLYAWRRLHRLYPPLVLALLLTAAFDLIGAHINAAYYAGQTPYESINQAAVGGSHSLAALLGGLTFQSALASPTFGTNGPLWSLSYEFWFYVLYPVLLLISRRLGSWGMISAAGLYSGCALILLRIGAPALPTWLLNVSVFWIIWAAGALIAEAYAGRTRVPGLRWLGGPASASLVALAIINALRRVDPVNGIDSPERDLAWGLTLAVLLAYMLMAPGPVVTRLANRAMRFLSPLGTISYSLYVVHFPWLALLSAWWLSQHSRLPSGAELAIPGALSSFALAALCWYLVERHFISPRRTQVGHAGISSDDVVSPAGDGTSIVPRRVSFAQK